MLGSRKSWLVSLIGHIANEINKKKPPPGGFLLLKNIVLHAEKNYNKKTYINEVSVMHYLLSPSGCNSFQHDFSACDLLFAVKDVEDFKKRLFYAMDDYVDKLNKNQHDCSEFVFEGQEFPEKNFFFYDKFNDLWSCYKPILVELVSKDDLECFVVEASIGTRRSYLPSGYRIVWGENKAVVEAELQKAYELLSADRKIPFYSMLGAYFKADEIVGYEFHSGNEPKLKPFNALGRVFSLEEFFSKEAE